MSNGNECDFLSFTNICNFKSEIALQADSVNGSSNEDEYYKATMSFLGNTVKSNLLLVYFGSYANKHNLLYIVLPCLLLDLVSIAWLLDIGTVMLLANMFFHSFKC